jgi:hypothetical protein
MEGIDLFGSPVLGDAIVVMAAELDGNHKANPKSIAKALDDHRIRMFGLAMGAVNTRNVVSGGLVNSTYSQGLAYSRGGVDNQVLETGDDNFYPLTMNSGGLVRGVLNAKERFNPDDAKLKAMLALRVQQIFNSVSTFYKMEIESPARTEEWKLDVVERVHKIAPQMWILQPHSVGPCS